MIDKLLKVGEKYGSKLCNIRGGTDGSRLSEMGLPTPNIWNGTANFHSVNEYNVIDEAVESIQFLLELFEI